MIKRLVFLGAALFWAPQAFAQADDEAAARAAAESAVQEPAGEAEAPPPPKRRGRRAAAAAAAPAAPGGPSGALKLRLAEIAKVHKNQLAFGALEAELWKTFWTKLRDERGLFELRLDKQREGFIDSLRSLDPSDHHQSLVDFEALQNNVIRSFEESLASKIRDFIAERERKMREFGAAQESERARLAQESSDIWEDQKAKLNIQPPSEDERQVKEKKPKKKR